MGANVVPPFEGQLKRGYAVRSEVSTVGQDLKEHQPRLISWNLTSACNLRCPHCYLDAGKKGKRELTTEECYSLIDEMSVLGAEMLILTGGEPLLRKDIFSVARYASQKGIMVVMGTNGVLIDEALATTLKESGVRGVGISLDSLNSEKHDSFRGMKGCWEKAVMGIETCVRLELPVIIQTTVTEWNFEEIPALMKFAYQKGAQAFNLYYLVCTGRGEKLTDITPQQYEDSLAYLVEAQTNYPGMMVRAKCAPHGSRIAYQRGLPFLSGAGCLAGTSYLRISSEGDITPCPYLPLVAGNLREERLEQIWKGSDLFKELRELQLKGRCGACEYRKVCVGCRARAWAVTGDYLEEDPWCTYQPAGGDALPLNEIEWSMEAKERLQRVPSFIRGKVELSIEEYARVKGTGIVTVELMDEARKAMGSYTPRKP